MSDIIYNIYFNFLIIFWNNILELHCMRCKAFMSVFRELKELVYCLSTHFTMNFTEIFLNKM